MMQLRFVMHGVESEKTKLLIFLWGLGRRLGDVDVDVLEA
jgi:hypothetical protein